MRKQNNNKAAVIAAERNIMILSKIRNVVVVLGLGSVLISSAWTLGAAEIVVQTDTVVEVNGQSTIPDGFFSITTYIMAPIPMTSIPSTRPIACGLPPYREVACGQY
jgi:hypothetical protein